MIKSYRRYTRFFISPLSFSFFATVAICYVAAVLIITDFLFSAGQTTCGGMSMPTEKLTAWQRAAVLAAEGACLLPYLLSLLWGLYIQYRPPYRLPAVPAEIQPVVFTTLSALLYGAAKAPLRLWRAAVYTRLCASPTALPSLRPTRHGLAAVGWRWRLWWRRAAAIALACAPSALILGYGAAVSGQANAVQPALCLTAGALLLLVGIVSAALWQCRYVLATLYILRGIPPAAAMALSARAMRKHLGKYINFLGTELPRLLPCLLLVPAAWCIPAFRRRHTAMLISLMPDS